MDATLNVEIWSDIACPWCYIGKRRFEAALAEFPHAAGVCVVWRSFELDPSAPAVQPEGQAYVARLARKYGTSLAAAQGMIDRMTEVARNEGIAMDFARVRGGNTLDAHRLLHLARAHGLQDALKERLLRAYFCEGAALGEPGTLVALAAEVGLDPDQAQGVLATDAYRDAVRADEARAAALGISGVPCFVLEERYAVEGAQPSTALLAALQRAWGALAAPMPDGPDGAAACEPGGCG